MVNGKMYAEEQKLTKQKKKELSAMDNIFDNFNLFLGVVLAQRRSSCQPEVEEKLKWLTKLGSILSLSDRNLCKITDNFDYYY